MSFSVVPPRLRETRHVSAAYPFTSVAPPTRYLYLGPVARPAPGFDLSSQIRPQDRAASSELSAG